MCWACFGMGLLEIALLWLVNRDVVLLRIRSMLFRTAVSVARCSWQEHGSCRVDSSSIESVKQYSGRCMRSTK